MGRVHKKSGAGAGAAGAAAGKTAKTKTTKKTSVASRHTKRKDPTAGGASAAASAKAKAKATLYEMLVSDGIAVVDVSSHYDAWRAGLLAMLREMGHTVLWPAAGGFGAVGVPEYILSEAVYAIDAAFNGQIQNVLAEAVRARGGLGVVKTAYARMFDDRVGVRPASGYVTFDGKTTFRSVIPANATPHRDVSAGAVDTLTCGGFVNLGTRDQYFRAVPGTGLGFRKEVTKGKFAKLNAEESLMMRKKMRTFVVKKGHAIVFDSTTVHSVRQTTADKKTPDAAELAKTQLEDADLRKFVSFWVVASTATVQTPDVKLNRWSARLSTGYLPLLPSAQEIPLFPKNWANLCKERLALFRAQFHGTGSSASVLIGDDKKDARFPVCRKLLDYPQGWRNVYEVNPVPPAPLKISSPGDKSEASDGDDDGSSSDSDSDSSSGSEDVVVSDAPPPSRRRRIIEEDDDEESAYSEAGEGEDEGEDESDESAESESEDESEESELEHASSSSSGD